MRIVDLRLQIDGTEYLHSALRNLNWCEVQEMTMDATAEIAQDFIPPLPESVEATGLSFQFLADLALKTTGTESSVTSVGVGERMCLPLHLAEELMQHLYREKLIENRGRVSFNNNRYALLDRGWEQLKRLMEISGYIGPAPVSLNAYSAMVRSQAKPEEVIGPPAVAAAFHDLVLPESLLQTVGFAINSRRSLFISGGPGLGKTAVAERMNNALQKPVWIPYSVAVDEHVINVYDAHNHERTFDEDSYESYDRRWLRIMRPLIIVGGEMTLETTDLIYNRASRYYEAPFQVKANCGTLVIDDFGRQRVEPEELLDRPA
jgi:predicted ATPase with chaperone activity